MAPRSGFKIPSDPRELSRVNWVEDLFLALQAEYGDIGKDNSWSSTNRFVRIADTIVIKHQRPTSWMRMNKEGGIDRKTKLKDLNANEIIKKFQAAHTTASKSDIIGYHVCALKDSLGRPGPVQIEYVTNET